MAFSYDFSNLSTTTSSGRLNSVRYLIGDTDSSDPLLQDEEVNFALSQNGTNIYNAASWCCKAIVAKFSRLVDTQLDGALSSKYSDRVKQYINLGIQIEQLGKKMSPNSFGLFAGGISLTEMYVAQQDPDRPSSSFRVGQFDNAGAVNSYFPDYPK